MTPIKNLIRSFIESLETEKGYAKNTCRGYRNDLAEFESYLVENRFPENRRMPGRDLIGIDDVDGIHIRGYLGYLHKRNKNISHASSRQCGLFLNFSSNGETLKTILRIRFLLLNRKKPFRLIFPLMKCFGCLTPSEPIAFWMSETGQFLKSFTPAAYGCRNSSE